MEMFVAMTTTPQAKPPRPIATPCVKVCAVDGASGYCLGCRRTLAEIAGWARFSDEERAAITAALPDRPDPMIALMAATTGR
jgi:predicted Fe-S protein YdhL (DUF1289 family)